MFSFIMVLIISYIIGWVLGFINGFTGGKLKWIILAMVGLFFVYLVSKMGFSLAVAVMLLIAVIVVRFVWNFVKGALYGVLSIFK